MSKPTDFQQRVIKSVANEIEYWSRSNDIHSPSHCTSIEHDMFSNLDEWWPDQDLPIAGQRYLELQKICEITRNLWAAIADLDKCHLREEAAKNFKL